MNDEAVDENKQDPSNERTMEDKKRPAVKITPDNEVAKEAPKAEEQSDEDDKKASRQVDQGEGSPRPNDVQLPNNDSTTKSETTISNHLPTQPIKKARTAYFIFADEKRQEIQKRVRQFWILQRKRWRWFGFSLTPSILFLQHPGEGVGIIARETGQLWAQLDEAAKAEYHVKSAQERERVSQELAKYNLDNVELDLPTLSDRDLNTLIFPLARLRKITKLDPDVKGVSKEALLLITKCAEMMTSKLGQESVKVAQLQNRRKLLPEDVAQVCATREQFLFLREDVKDLLKEQHLVNKKALEIMENHRKS